MRPGLVAGCLALSLALAGAVHAQTVQGVVGGYLGSRPLRAAYGVSFHRTVGGFGAELARTGEPGWIGRLGAVDEGAFTCEASGTVMFVEGCAGNSTAASVSTPYGDGFDRALHARGGWSWGTFAFEAGAIARTDALRRDQARGPWRFAPDVVVRLSGERGDVEVGAGAYALPTIASPGVFLRGRRHLGAGGSWLALAVGGHELGPWGDNPHLRIDLEAMAALGGERARWWLGGGLAVLQGSASTLESRVTLGVAF